MAHAHVDRTDGIAAYGIGTTVHGALDDSDLNNAGHVVTVHAGAPGMLSPQFPVPEMSRQMLHGAPFVSMFPLNVLPKTLLLLELKISHAQVLSEDGLAFTVPPKFVTVLPVAQLPFALKNLSPSSERPVVSLIATLPSKLFAVVDTLTMRPLCLPAGSEAVSVCGRSLFIDVLFRY